MLHILIIPSWYATAAAPNRGIFFREQAEALQKAGHQVGMLVAPELRANRSLLRMRRPADLRSEFSMELDRGLPTYRVTTGGWAPNRIEPAKQWLLARTGRAAFARYVADHGMPDVLHAHSMLYGGWLATELGQRHSLPVVITEHSSAFLRGMIDRSQARLIRSALRRADHVFAVSTALAEALSAFGSRPVEVLGNMVQTDYFQPPAVELPEGLFRFCALGQLRPVKRYDLLLDAFANRFQGEPIRLEIAGDGPLDAALARQAEALGIGSQVSFLGELNRPGVLELLQRSHALVSTSETETFGVTLIEAMACGRPVVSTRSGGPEMFIDETNGCLVPCGDAMAIGDAMHRLWKNYAMYDRELIREQCIARFSTPVIRTRLEEIYRGLVTSS